ncbi:MAG: hypothetical protein IPJ06_04705 [Saprospiraceae bacterium]|nr:hypothetical protein [Saprospiraceae bacterium]
MMQLVRDDLEAEYMTPIADIPSYRISYRGKEIRWNTRKPVVLQNLVALLDSFTVNEGWLEPERAFRSEQVNRREEELIVQPAGHRPGPMDGHVPRCRLIPHSPDRSGRHLSSCRI